MPVIMIIALIFLVMVQFQLFEIAFIKLGLEPTTSALILISSLLGSVINIPLFSLKTHTDSDLPPRQTDRLAR